MVKPRRNPAIEYVNPAIPEFELTPLRGARYQARVPDTLDMAERARLAVHGLTGHTDPQSNAEIYWCAEFGAKPPTMYHDTNDWCEYKYYAPSLLLREACGSEDALEVEWHRMANLLQMQAPDGHLYIPTKGRPWATDFGMGGPMYVTDLGEQFWFVPMTGKILEAAAAYYLLTGDPQWKTLVSRGVEAASRLLVDKGDYAYSDKVIYLPGDAATGGPVPPPHIHHGLAWLGEGLIAVHRMLGFEQALQTAHKLARFFMSHSAFVGPNGEFRTGHGACDFDTPTPVHFHTNTRIRQLMLGAGLLAGDQELLDLARVGYEYGKAHGDTLMGYFPEWLDEGPASPGRTSEICEVADMLDMARTLSLAGIADCWDDIDRWTRNMFTEAQLVETDWAYEYSARHGEGTDHPYAVRENVPERCRGVWGGCIAANDWQGHPVVSMPACCEGNAARQHYLLWRDMVSWDTDRNRLSVHLLMNRASPWADVISHIPCRGKVEVELKRSCEVALRIPEWTPPQDFKCLVNGAAAQPQWEGRYAVVRAKEGDGLTFSFPIEERKEKLDIERRSYDVIVRGNEIVDISPPGQHLPIFCKPHLRQEEPRWHTVERFVAHEVTARF